MKPVTARHLPAVLLVLGIACSEPGPEVDAGPPPPPKPTAVASLEGLAGEVMLTHDGVRAAAKAQEVFTGDVVETGADGQASIRFRDGRVVELGPEAFITIQEGEGGLIVNVARGIVLTRLLAGPPGEAAVILTVLTPSGLVRVGRGELNVDVTGEETKIEVKAGEIEIVSRGGQSTKLGPGELGSLTATGATARAITLEPVQVLLLPNGRTELKRKDAKSWTGVSARKPPELAEGDQVRVRDGNASLKVKDATSRFTLGRGAELVMGTAVPGDGVETLSLQLGRGALTAATARDRKVRLNPGGGVTLVAAEGAQYTLTKTKAGFDLNATVGDLSIEREGSEATQVTGGQTAQLTAAGVVTKDVAREIVAVPTRGGLRLLHPGIGQIALSWPGEAGKAYRVTVATNSALSNPILDGVVHQTYLNVPVPLRGGLFWKVTEGDTEVARGNLSCTPELRSGDLGRPRNDVPDGPEKTFIYFQDKAPSITFTWKATPNAAKYKVTVYAEGKLGTPLEERESKELTLSLPENALGEGRYVWSVTPLDAAGRGLAGGRMNKLEVTYDNAVPGLVIKSPRNGDPWRSQVPVVGVVPVGARAWANGRSLPLDDKGRFDTTVAPLPGGRVVFRTVMESGEVYVVRILKRGS